MACISFLFPLYRMSDYLVVIILSFLLYLLASFGMSFIFAKKGAVEVVPVEILATDTV